MGLGRALIKIRRAIQFYIFFSSVGLKTATLRSNERLENSMNSLAQQLSRLEEHLVRSVHEAGGDGDVVYTTHIDPLAREEQEKLMRKQAAIINSMSVIQASIGRLSGELFALV